MSTLVFLTALCLVSPVLSQTTPIPDANKTTNATIQLSPGTSKVFSLADYNITTTLTVTGVSPSSRFFVIQVHTQYASLLLKRTSPPVEEESGSSVGMVQMLNGSSISEISWTVGVDKRTIGGEGFPVSVLATLQEYGEDVPVPGGCNQVFALATDPNIHVMSADYNSEIWFQWASVGTAAGEIPPNCENKQDMGRLTYEVYVAYTSEVDDSVNGLFDVIRSMTTVERMRSKAVKVKTVENDGAHKSMVNVNSQRGQGSVYGVIVTDTQSGLSAGYVSSVSYACNYTAGECSLQYKAVEWVMLVACGVAGLILLVLGHHFIRTEMMLMGFIEVALISFTLLSLSPSLSETVRIAVACVLGVLGGVGWLLVWVRVNFPSISVMVPGLCAGFLVAGALFMTPVANLSWWETNTSYALAFTCVKLLFAVVFLCSPRTLNILSCSLVGGYCMTMVAAIPLKSTLRLLVLNVFRHAAIRDYVSIIVVAPFSVNDIVLTLVWLVLTVVAACWQFYRAKGKPHFPRRHRQILRQGVPEGRAHSQPAPSPDDERTPLLGSQPPPASYGDSINRVPNTPEISRPM